jgi:hypothetical protein
LDRLFEREEFENVIEISKNLSLTVFVWAVGKVKSVKPDWAPKNPDLFGLFKQTVDLMASHPAFSDGFFNDAKSGTRFYHQKLDMKAKAGRMVIWPAAWTHMHSGIIPNKGTKYIATGWFSYD